jgi:xylan 1,4-beta-xylosidase
VFAATFLLDGMASSMGRLDALSHWVASDHFEELGVPERLQHGGFGLLTVGNLRKPRWWAMALLQRLGDSRLEVCLDGDGAGALVSALAARGADGDVGVLLWNSSLDQSRVLGDPLLARDVTLTVAGLPPGQATVRHWRVDEEHSNVFAAWQQLAAGSRDWPDDDEWRRLQAADDLAELTAPTTVEIATDGQWSTSFHLPQPGISFVQVSAKV